MTEHVSVMLKEVLTFLEADPKKEKTLFLDCTLGGAGHTRAMLEKNQKLFAVGVDQDARAIAKAKEVLKDFETRCCFMNTNFAEMNFRSEELQRALGHKGFEQPLFDRVLLDLGISSDQLNDPSRGFSFRNDGPLDMRMSEDVQESAAQIVNERTPRELKRIFLEGGMNQREASVLVSEIVQTRPHETTHAFADVCRKALRKVAPGKKGADLATVPFQAVRIAVNKEFESLKNFLETAKDILAPAARIAVISFHSLEDRIVTKTFRSWAKGPDVPNRLPVPGDINQSFGKLLTKSAVLPSEEELKFNSRARSARLRCFEVA